MKKFQALVEALEALDLLNQFISADSEKYLESEEVRKPLEKAADDIFKIYEKLSADPGADDH